MSSSLRATFSEGNSIVDSFLVDKNTAMAPIDLDDYDCSEEINTFYGTIQKYDSNIIIIETESVIFQKDLDKTNLSIDNISTTCHE